MDTWQSLVGVVPTAAVVSALVTLGIRWLDKPRARLVFEVQMTESRFVDKTPEALHMMPIAATNVGDGTAYDVEFLGDRCDVAVELPPLGPSHAHRYEMWLPKIAPGETVLVKAGMRRGQEANAVLVVRWDHSPGRPMVGIRRQIRQVKLAAIDVAVPFPVGMFEPAMLPKRFRRWRELSRYTDRGQMRHRSGEEPN